MPGGHAGRPAGRRPCLAADGEPRALAAAAGLRPWRPHEDRDGRSRDRGRGQALAHHRGPHRRADPQPGLGELDRARCRSKTPKAPKRTKKPVTRPRPGHADLAGALKYDLHDARYILERASARETAARVAAGAIAKAFLGEFGMQVLSHVVALGRVRLLERRGLGGTASRSAASRRCCWGAWRKTTELQNESRGG